MNWHLRATILAVLAGSGAASVGLTSWLVLRLAGEQVLARVWSPLLGGHALLLAVGAAVIVLLHRRAFAPVAGFVDHVSAMGQGDLRERATPPQQEWTELARALNVAAAQLRQQFAVRDERLLQMHGELTVDALTGLATREPFRNGLDEALRRGDATPVGAVVLVRVRGLPSLNSTHGRDHADEYLRLLAERLKVFTISLRQPAALVGRLNGTDFGLLLPGLSTIRLSAELEMLAQGLGTVAEQSWADLDPPVWIGATLWTEGDEPLRILERADAALQACEAAGARWRTTGTSDQSLVRSAAQWRDLIDGGLDTGRFAIDAFDVWAADGTLHHREVVVRLQSSDGSVVTGAELMPAAIRSHRTPDIDLRIIELALAQIEDSGDRLAVTISVESVKRPNFLHRLGILLAESSKLSRSLILQVDAVATGRTMDDLDDFLALLAKHGVTSGIGHYVGEAVHLTHWVAQGLGFVKLRADVTRDLARELERTGRSAARQRWLRNFMASAQALDVDVLACGLQLPEDVSQAFLLGMTAASGPALEQHARGPQPPRTPASAARAAPVQAMASD